MKKIQLLEANDKVTTKTWCRPLQYDDLWYSDGYREVSDYSGSPVNSYRWSRVDDVLGPHVGKTVAEICKELHRNYEFVKGDLPKSHIFFRL